MNPKLELRHAYEVIRTEVEVNRDINTLAQMALERIKAVQHSRNPIALQETLNEVAVLLRAIRLTAAHHEANLGECLESYIMEGNP